MRIVWGHNLPMRHFHAFLEPYPNEEKYSLFYPFVKGDTA